MIEIYRLLVGIGDFDRNLELLLKMPFYTQYIQAAKLFLVHIKEGIDLRDAEVLDHI